MKTPTARFHEELPLVLAAKAGDRAAMAALWHKYENLFRQFVFKTTEREPFENHMGLLFETFARCVKHYNPEKGVQFSSYCQLPMMRELRRAVRGAATIVTVNREPPSLRPEKYRQGSLEKNDRAFRVGQAHPNLYAPDKHKSPLDATIDAETRAAMVEVSETVIQTSTSGQADALGLVARGYRLFRLGDALGKHHKAVQASLHAGKIKARDRLGKSKYWRSWANELPAWDAHHQPGQGAATPRPTPQSGPPGGPDAPDASGGIVGEGNTGPITVTEHGTCTK